MMRSDTQTVRIETSSKTVLEFVSRPENLPRWAVGFCRSVRREADRWIVHTPEELEMELDCIADATRGTVDFHASPAPGVESVAFSRVVSVGDGADYMFTIVQGPGMPDAVFESQRTHLGEELQLLKRALEGPANGSA